MAIRVGNAPVSWAVYEADRPNPPYSLVLDQIAEAGYAGTELGPYGYLPTEPAKLAGELHRRNLDLGSSFVPLPLEDPKRRSRSCGPWRHARPWAVVPTWPRVCGRSAAKWFVAG